jgi:signal transduction histidine kinase
MESLAELTPGVDIAVQVRRLAGPLWIFMDPGRLHQTVVNLLTYACDAAVSNDVTVQVAAVEEYAELIIENRRWSLTPMDRRRVFEPFARIPGKEAGLSLAVARRNVEDARGSIVCVAGREGGACFCVRLPLFATSC